MVGVSKSSIANRTKLMLMSCNILFRVWHGHDLLFPVPKFQRWIPMFPFVCLKGVWDHTTTTEQAWEGIAVILGKVVTELSFGPDVSWSVCWAGLDRFLPQRWCWSLLFPIQGPPRRKFLSFYSSLLCDLLSCREDRRSSDARFSCRNHGK